MSKVVTTKYGLKIIYKKVKDVEGVAVTIRFDAGSANDPKNKKGLAHMTEHCLANCSNEVLTKKELYDNSSFFPYKNAMTGVSDMAFVGLCNKKDFESLMNDLTSGFTNFTNFKEEFEKEKEVVLQEIATKRKTNDYQSFMLYMKHIRREANMKNIAEHAILGSAESVKKLTAKDVIDFKNTYFSINNAVVSVAGNISLKDVKKVCEKFLCARLNKVGEKGFNYENSLSIKDNVTVIEEPWEEQKSLLKISWSYKDAPKFITHREGCIRTIVRNVLTSMALKKFRAENSSCYGVSVELYNEYKNFCVEFSVACAHKKVEQNFNLFLEFVEELKKDGLSKTLFEYERELYFGRHNIDHVSLLNMTRALLLSYNNYGAITTDKQKKRNNKAFEKIAFEEFNDYALSAFVSRPNVILLTNSDVELDISKLRKVLKKK